MCSSTASDSHLLAWIGHTNIFTALGLVYSLSYIYHCSFLTNSVLVSNVTMTVTLCLVFEKIWFHMLSHFFVSSFPLSIFHEGVLMQVGHISQFVCCQSNFSLTSLTWLMLGRTFFICLFRWLLSNAFHLPIVWVFLTSSVLILLMCSSRYIFLPSIPLF